MLMDSTHFVEIHLIHQRTQRRTVVHLGDPVEHGESEWTLDQTGVDYNRFRFVRAGANQVSLEYLEGDSVVTIDGQLLAQSPYIVDGALLAIDDDEFRLELHENSLETAEPFIDGGWVSMTGSFRPHNEDAIGVYQQPPYHLYIVADGVGGAEAGELISEFAVKYLLTTFHQNLGSQVQWREIFRQAFVAINSEARGFARQASQQTGKPVQAGCTLTVLVIDGWDATVFHVGDSRLYHQQDGVLRQRTEDHSKVSAHNPNPNATKRNVLVKGIGKSDTIIPDIEQFRLKPGDRFLLCSDGMSDRLNHDEIAQMIASMPPQRLAARLAKMADERRSGDNITVLVLNIGTQSNPDISGVRPMPQERAFIGPQTGWTPRLQYIPDQPITADSTHNGQSSGNSTLKIGVAVLVIVIVLVIVVALVLLSSGSAF